MTLKALLFDLDGTLIDSDPLHAAVFVDFLGARGVELAHEDYVSRFHGRRNEDIFAEVLPNEDPWEMHLTKEAAFRERLGDTADPIKGAPDLLQLAKKRGWQTGVVTNACRENMHASLSAIGLIDRFDFMISADDLPIGKPDPLIYRTAVEALNVTADETLVFEDSPSGITAAIEAGLTVIGMETSLSKSNLSRLGTKLSIRDFTDPALEKYLSVPEGAFE